MESGDVGMESGDMGMESGVCHVGMEYGDYMEINYEEIGYVVWTME